MPADESYQFQREGYDLFNRGEFDQVLAMVSDDCEIQVYPAGLSLHGKEGFRQMMEHHRRPFPDGKVEIISQLSGNDGVVSEGVYHGTNTAPLLMPDGSEIPATGKELHARFCEIWRIRDGKIISLHNYGDNLAVLVQLGLMPVGEPATA